MNIAWGDFSFFWYLSVSVLAYFIFAIYCILKPCRGNGVIFLSSFGWGFNVCEEGAKLVTGKLLAASLWKKYLWMMKVQETWVCMLPRVSGGNEPFFCLNSPIIYFLMWYQDCIPGTASLWQGNELFGKEKSLAAKILFYKVIDAEKSLLDLKEIRVLECFGL